MAKKKAAKKKAKKAPRKPAPKPALVRGKVPTLRQVALRLARVQTELLFDAEADVVPQRVLAIQDELERAHRELEEWNASRLYRPAGR